MEEVEVERLERIARNIIPNYLQMERVEGTLGTIYLAHGLTADNKIIGIWGHRGVARHIEFQNDASLEDVRQALVNDAAGLLEMMAERGLLNGGNG